MMIDNTNTNTNTSTNTNTNNNEQGASDLYERSLSGRESCFGFVLPFSLAVKRSKVWASF